MPSDRGKYSLTSAQSGIQPSGPRDKWPCERGGLPAHRARVRALALLDAAHVPIHPAIERDLHTVDGIAALVERFDIEPLPDFPAK